MNDDNQKNDPANWTHETVSNTVILKSQGMTGVRHLGNLHVIRGNRNNGVSIQREYLGRANWYKSHVEHMSIPEMHKALRELGNQLAAGFTWSNPPRELTTAERLDTEESLKIVQHAYTISMHRAHHAPQAQVERIEEIKAHNLENWPENAPYGSMGLQAHFADLVTTWVNVDGMLNESRLAHIDSRAEREGKSAIYFGSIPDCEAFINYYALSNFVAMSGSTPNARRNDPAAPASAWIQLRNEFPTEDIETFNDAVASAFGQLAFIHEEREIVAESDAYMSIATTQFFIKREQIALEKIRAARIELGTVK